MAYYSNKKYNVLGVGEGDGSILIYYGSTWVDSSDAFATGETATTLINLQNTSDAVSGTQQYSPFIALIGEGYGTTSTSSEECSVRLGNVPVQAAEAQAKLVFMLDDDQGAEFEAASIRRSGENSGILSINNNGLANTTGISLDLINSTDSTVGTYQNSPYLTLTGTAWSTTGSSSQDCKVYIGNTPVNSTKAHAKMSVKLLDNQGSSLEALTLERTGQYKSLLQSSMLSLGATPIVSGFSLKNASNAISTMSQNSPFMEFIGSGYENDDSSAKECTVRIGNAPLEGTTYAQANLSVLLNDNQGAEFEALSLKRTGAAASILSANQQTLTYSALGETETAALTLQNETSAASGTGQYSPFICFIGQAWDADGSTSVTRSARMGVVTTEANDAYGSFQLDVMDNVGTWVTAMNIHNGDTGKHDIDFPSGGYIGATSFTLNAAGQGDVRWQTPEIDSVIAPGIQSYVNKPWMVSMDSLTDASGATCVKTLWKSGKASHSAIVNDVTISKFGYSLSGATKTLEESFSIHQDGCVTRKQHTVGHATLTSGTGTNAITWTAIESGSAGDTASVILVESGASTSLSVTNVTDTITVNLATDGDSNAISTAAEVVAAVADHNGALQSADYVSAVATDGTGAGVVVAAAEADLTGGVGSSDEAKCTTDYATCMFTDGDAGDPCFAYYLTDTWYVMGTSTAVDSS